MVYCSSVFKQWIFVLTVLHGCYLYPCASCVWLCAFLNDVYICVSWQDSLQGGIWSLWIFLMKSWGRSFVFVVTAGLRRRRMMGRSCESWPALTTTCWTLTRRQVGCSETHTSIHTRPHPYYQNNCMFTCPCVWFAKGLCVETLDSTMCTLSASRGLSKIEGLVYFMGGFVAFLMCAGFPCVPTLMKLSVMWLSCEWMGECVSVWCHGVVSGVSSHLLPRIDSASSTTPTRIKQFLPQWTCSLGSFYLKVWYTWSSWTFFFKLFKKKKKTFRW